MRSFKRMRVGGFNLMSVLVGAVLGTLFGDEIKEKVPFLKNLNLKK